MRFFNTAGPIDPQRHYYIAHRLNEDELKNLISQEKYFILHAPRQSGKTTAIQMFVKTLNVDGVYKALYINIEPAQIVRNNVKDGMEIILGQIRGRAKIACPSDDPIFDIVEKGLQRLSGGSLQEALQAWSTESEKKIILFFDEIDSLIGDTLISVLRQLRAGYTDRPDYFPQSICLVGVRDVRDYRIWSSDEQSMVLGGSAFNIKAESLTLPNFSLEHVHDLYKQHEIETGQKITSDAINYAFKLTLGQPWLVNALAYEACFRDVTDRNKPITKEVIERAKQVLIMRIDTHIDQLVDKLREPRVYGIIDAIISGTGEEADFPVDDLQYVRDLGLISLRGIAIANPIYQEVIPLALTYTKQEGIVQLLAWYQNSDRSLNMHKLLEAFTRFYRENSEIWLEKFDYKKSGPHLLLMAFLQRIIIDGGKIHRDYALGQGRVDLFIEFRTQRIVIEMKVRRGEKSLSEALEDTAHYMDINGATEGHLILFDLTKGKSWDEKIYTKQYIVNKQLIMAWGL